MAAAQSQADFFGAMKEFYTNMMADLPNRSAILMDKIEEATSVQWGGEGKYAVVPIHVESGLRGSGAYTEGADMNVYEAQDYDQMKVYVKSLAFPIELSLEAREAVKKGPGAFIDSKGSEIEQNMKWLREKQARMGYGDGFGRLGLVEAISETGGTHTIITLTAESNIRWIRPTMRIDAWAPAYPPANRRNHSGGADSNTTRDVGWPVTSVTPSARQFRVLGLMVTGAGGDATVVGDQILPENVGIGATGNQYGTGVEFAGFRHLVSDNNILTTLQGLTLDTYPALKGYRDTAGVDRDITIDLLQKTVDAIEDEGGKEPDFIAMNKGQRRKLLAIGLTDVRHESQKLKLGYKELDWNGKKFFVDRLAYPKMIFMGSMSAFKRATLIPLGAIDGSPAGLRIYRKTAFEWVFGTVGNMFVTHPNQCGWIEDLNEP